MRVSELLQRRQELLEQITHIDNTIEAERKRTEEFERKKSSELKAYLKERGYKYAEDSQGNIVVTFDVPYLNFDKPLDDGY